MAHLQELMAAGLPAVLARMLGNNQIAQYNAAGSTQATATPLPRNFAILGNAGATTQGVMVGAATGAAVSAFFNAGPNALMLYPYAGDAFQNLQPNVALTVQPFATVVMVPSNESWLVSITTPPGVTQTPGGLSGQVQVNQAGQLGGITMSGDAVWNTGSGVLTVQGIQTRPVLNNAPLDGQVLGYSAHLGAWVPIFGGSGLPSNVDKVSIVGDGIIIPLSVGAIDCGSYSPTGSGAQSVQLHRTTTNTPPPAPLQAGSLSVELGADTRVWLGDGTANRLLCSTNPSDVVLSGYCVISPTPPAVGSTTGVLWWDSVGGQLYIRFNDGNSVQWVAVLSAAAAPPANMQAGTGITINVGTTPPTIALQTPVAIANGGTGAMSASSALTSLGAVPAAGGNMTGPLVLSGDATASLSPTTLQQVNANFVHKTGDTMSGQLTVNENVALPASAFTTASLWGIGANNTTPIIALDGYGSPCYPSFLGRRARGTAAAPSAVQSGDYLVQLACQGYGASAWGSNNAAALVLQATENWTATNEGCEFTVNTTPNGSTAAVTGLTISGTAATFFGNVTVPVNSGFYVNGATSGTPGRMWSDSVNFNFNMVSSSGSFVVTNYAVTSNIFVLSNAGNASFVGQVSAGGGVATGSTSTPQFGTSTNYTAIYPPDGVQVNRTILLGTNATDPNNYYRNTGHVFADQTGSNLLLTISLSSQIFGGGGVICGSPTGGGHGAGTLSAVQVYGNNVLLTSDANLKTDIAPLPAALPLVAAIEPRRFRWKPLPEKQPLGMVPGGDGEMVPSYLAGDGAPEDFATAENRGFLAQDFAEVGLNRVGADGTQSLDLGGLVATLWQAVRELAHKVDSLEGAR